MEVIILKLIYEDTDITKGVDVKKAEFIDTAGGRADSLELRFSDTKGIWSEWKPSKNDKIQISENGLSSGTMYIDELEQLRGMFIIRALSIPQDAKTHNTKSWESIRFLEFATEIASKHGFSVETYGIENYLYNRVDQFEQSDFEFLAWRCLIEGFMLKTFDRKVVIYSQDFIEKIPSVKSIPISCFDGDYKFKSKSTGIYSGCQASCNGIKVVFKPQKKVFGALLKCNNIHFSSVNEGNRFARNLLKSENKYETTGAFATKLDTGLSAGSNIDISGIGIADGKYFCEQIRHDMVSSGKSTFRVRKPLEGY